jgi:hypothetical protein
MAGRRPVSESHDRLRASAEKLGFELVDMPLVCELADGATITVTDLTIVPMGDVFAHRQLTYHRKGSPSHPAVEVVFEVRSKVPVCVSLRVWAESESESPVRAINFTDIKLDEMRLDVYAYTGVFVRNPDNGEFVRKIGNPESTRGDRKYVEGASTRRKLTPEFLRRVAEIHTAAPEGGRHAAVKAAFRVEDSQAWRYIRSARASGLVK